MSRLSTRYLRWLALLLLVGAGAVGWISQNPRRVDPCERPDVLAVTSLIPGSTHRGIKEVPTRDDLVLWSQGTFENPLSDEHPFQFQMVRSYAVLRQGSRPVGLVGQQIDAEHHRVVLLEVGDRQIPVHIVEDYTKLPNRLIAYYHLYGLEPVEQLVASHLRHLVRVIRDGTPVVTTVIVDGLVHRKGTGIATEKVLEWLGGSFEFFERFCVPPPSPSDSTPPS